MPGIFSAILKLTWRKKRKDSLTDLELKHLGQTLAIGGFAIYALVHLLRACGIQWILNFICLPDQEASSTISDKKIHEEKAYKESTTAQPDKEVTSTKPEEKRAPFFKLETTAIYLALLLASGIIVEDLSKNIVASRDDELPADANWWERGFRDFNARINDLILDKDSELRLRSLFSISSSSEEGKNALVLRPREIFWEMVELTRRFDKTVGTHRARAVLIMLETKEHVPIKIPSMDEFGMAADGTPVLKQPAKQRIGRGVDYYVRERLTPEQIKQNGGVSQKQSFSSRVNEMYYNAKNKVFGHENYHQELSEIQDRISFSRSLALLCFVFFSLHCALFLLFAGVAFKNWKTHRISDMDLGRVKPLGSLAVVYVLGMCLAAMAYRSESDNFNKRVFGYYISLTHTAEENQGPQVEKGKDSKAG